METIDNIILEIENNIKNILDMNEENNIKDFDMSIPKERFGSPKKVRWVVQSNLIAENDVEVMGQAFMDLGIEVFWIDVIPFEESLPKFPIDDKINIYYGSTTLINNVYKALDNPIGIFFNEEFSIENYMSKDVWRDKMLNSDAIVTTLAQFSEMPYPDGAHFFIRPDADDKSFAGEVRSFKDIKEWRNNMVHYDNVMLDENTKIIVGDPYNIEKEWRNYIVNGKVITSSLYRENFKLKRSGENIPQDMIDFVEELCKSYVPNSVFVMDIALCGGDYYIIECGCMNSVGLYACDVKKLIDGITNYIENL